MIKLTYTLGNRSHTLLLDRSAERVQVELDGAVLDIPNLDVAPPRVTMHYQGKVVTAFVIQAGSERWVRVNGTTLVLTREQAGARHSHHKGQHQGIGSGIVVAPMPGQVRAVLVQAGARVTESQPLFVLEAMKMELKVLSPHDGIVAKINVIAGAAVDREQILGEIEQQP
ncbi:MAG: hypothetical protein IT331_16875 [Anaerolineae bacterium]|nr:hypothetical protein [Anaerolineae bacterium]